MIYKRYQYYGPKGIEWTDWFVWDSDLKIVLPKTKLLVEYKEE